MGKVVSIKFIARARDESASRLFQEFLEAAVADYARRFGVSEDFTCQFETRPSAPGDE